MKLRQDAAAAAAEAVVWIEQHCGGGAYNDTGVGGTELAGRDESLVCTTGSLVLWPGASNVIAGAANFSIDIRWGLRVLCGSPDMFDVYNALHSNGSDLVIQMLEQIPLQHRKMVTVAFTVQSCLSDGGTAGVGQMRCVRQRQRKSSRMWRQSAAGAM